MPKIFILAGEASGDLLGGKLMQALKDKNPEIQLIGVGGELMQEQGLNSLYPMSDLSVMGLFEVVKHLPILLSRLKQTEDFIRVQKPDLIVTIDLPDFSFRLAKKIRDLGIYHVHYVPPTVWAWRPGRAKKISQIIDHLLALYPFEPPYFEIHSLPTTFVGHTLIESAIGEIAVPREENLLCVLPGSRMGEVKKLLPIYKKALALLLNKHPKLKFIVPVAGQVKKYVVDEMTSWGMPIEFVYEEYERHVAMRRSTCALAASGTVNLELAMAGTPFVITYKLSALTGILARFVINTPYVCMSNILMDKEIVPELLQENCNPEKIFEKIELLLSNRQIRKEQIEGLSEVVKMLGRSNAKPSEIAADTLLGLV